MSTDRIADHQWRKLYVFLQGHPRAYAGQEEKCRRFVAAVHWILRAGAQWRELPADLGKWNTVFRRHARWEENGVWADMFKQFAQDPDMAAVMPASAAVRAHICAAGGSKKGGASKNSAWGGAGVASAASSISSSMRLAFPLQFILTGGERHDRSQAESLLAPFHFDAVIAGKGYSSDPLRELLAAQQIAVVIPPRRYRKRNIVERFINRTERFRRIFTRNEKLKQIPLETLTSRKRGA